MIKINTSKKAFISFVGMTIFAFLIEKFISPIFELLYSLFLKIGSLFITSFSDSVYQSISHGYSEQSSALVLYFIVITLLVCLSVLFLFIQDGYNDTIRRYDRLLNELTIFNSTENSINESQLPENKDTIESLEEGLSQIQADIDSLKKQYFQQNKQLITTITTEKKQSKREFLIIRIIFFSAILGILFIYGKHTFITTKINTTTRNIEMVAPYITDKEYKLLKANFYSISNQEDYSTLCNQIEEFASEHGIDLE